MTTAGEAIARGGAPTYLVTATATMQAPPERVYGIISDYHAGHPRILPEPYFSNLRVDEGGVGAGTRFHFDVRAFGRVQTLHSEVTEPVPGRELVERYPATGVVTTFRVEPRPDGGSRVTIESAMPRRPGIGGALEKLLMPRFLRRLFADELRRLSRVASETAALAALLALLGAPAAARAQAALPLVEGVQRGIRGDALGGVAEGALAPRRDPAVDPHRRPGLT